MGQVESQRVGPAHIAEIYFISPTTAPTVPFVGLEPLPHHSHRHPHRHPQGPAQAAATRSTTPPPPTKLLFMPPTSTDRLARTLTTLGAHASSAAFVTFAPDAGAPPTGSGSACAPEMSPLPISQHTLVTPLRPLEFERELVSHPDKGFVSDLLANKKRLRHWLPRPAFFSHSTQSIHSIHTCTHSHAVSYKGVPGWSCGRTIPSTSLGQPQVFRSWSGSEEGRGLEGDLPPLRTHRH